MIGVFVLSEAAKRRARKRRYDRLMAKYGDASIVDRIMAAEMWQGMTAEMLTDSWGRPVDRDREVYKTRTTETWKYGQADHPLLHMIWREHGGPPVRAPRQTNFGTQLIKRVLATEIGGRVDVNYRVDGVVFTAVAPLANAIDGNRHSPSK